MQANSTMQLDHAATPCKNIAHVIIRQYGSEPNVPTSLKQAIRLRWRKQALPPYCRQGPTTPVFSVIRQAVTLDAWEWRGGPYRTHETPTQNMYACSPQHGVLSVVSSCLFIGPSHQRGKGQHAWNASLCGYKEDLIWGLKYMGDWMLWAC